VNAYDTYFAECSATGSGGAVFADSGEMDFERLQGPSEDDDEFYGNTAGLNGGAIAMVEGGDLEVTDYGFLSNEAEELGGAVYVAGSTEADFWGAHLETGLAAGGGAVAAEENASITFTTSHAIENQALSGGAFYLSDTCELIVDGDYTDPRNSTVLPAVESNQAFLQGGGIWSDADDVVSIRAQLLGNSAALGGNVWSGVGSVVRLDGGRLISGSATGYGGNLYKVGNGLVTLAAATGGPVLESGVADRGGNAYLSDATVLVWEGVHIMGGTATYGGSLAVTGGSSLGMYGDPLTYLDNAVDSDDGVHLTDGIADVGGAMWVTGGSVALLSNVAVYGADFAVAVDGDSTVSATNTWFYGNTGAVVTVDHAKFTIDADFEICGDRDALENEYCSAFVENIGPAFGQVPGILVDAGGSEVDFHATAILRNDLSPSDEIIHLDAGTTASITTSLFGQNDSGAIGVSGAGATLDISASTFADQNGDVSYYSLSSGQINDSVFHGPAAGTSLYIAPTASTEGNCNVGDWTGTLVEILGGAPNYDGTDPLYIDPTGVYGEPNFRLESLSIAHDLCPDPQTYDLDGVLRAIGAGADSGAFEIPL
jgi:hypothetical protein